jgi:hypothetical protein
MLILLLDQQALAHKDSFFVSEAQQTTADAVGEGLIS